MCSSKPKSQPVTPAPPPETVDPAAIGARNRERNRARVTSGQQSTILTGNNGVPTQAATGQAKTLLGA